MTWKDIRAEYSQLDHTWRVMRPAFVLELYGEGPKVAPHGEALLQRFLDKIPEGTELYVLGNNDRSYKKLTPQSLRRVRKSLNELAKRGRFYSIKSAPEFEVGSFSIELSLGSEDLSTNDSVDIALPVEFGDVQRIPSTLTFITELVRDFPFWGAAAGYGFDLVWGREFEMVATPVMVRSALRYLGLQIRRRPEQSYAFRKLKSAGWLTFLDRELVELVGGSDALHLALEGVAEISTIRGGILLKAGETPPVGDVNRQEKDIFAMAAVNRAIAKIRIHRWISYNLLGVPPEIADGWLRRFD